MSNEKKLMSEEAAFNEVKEFVIKHKKKEFKKGMLTDDQIKEDYDEIIFYLQNGQIVIEKGIIKYTLCEPLYANAQDENLRKKHITFKSRVRPYDKTMLMDGIDPATQKGTFVIRLMSLASGLSKSEIKELCDEDFDLISQVSSVF